MKLDIYPLYGVRSANCKQILDCRITLPRIDYTLNAPPGGGAPTT